MTHGERRYRAFISYSHKDQKVARWLHRKLESYRLPKPMRERTPAQGHPLRPVFLDREELASATSLSDSIVEALQHSAALIVICSPHAVASRWVNEEIRQFRAQFPDRPVFAVVAKGNPATDPRRDPSEAAIPLQLLLADISEPEGTLGEPLAVDIRREADGRQSAFLKLAAGLLGVPYDQLRRREQRRRNQIRVVAFSLSFTLTASFALLAWRATVARDEARAARAQAELELLSERQTREFLLSVFQLADPGEARGEVVTVREVLDAAVARIDSTEFARPVIKSRFLSTMGQAYSSLGMNRKSVDLLRQSLQPLSADEQDRDALAQRIDSELELADVLFDMGEYEESLAGIKRVTGDPQKMFITPLQLAYAHNIEGDILSYLEQDEAAEAAYQEALENLSKASASSEEEASSRSRSLGGMAVLDHFAGNYQASMEKYAAAVDILLPVFGERHPDTIWTLVSWGSAAYSAGDIQTARDAWTRSLKTAQTVLGTSHPEVGTIKNNLGRLLFESGDYEPAEAYLREAVAIDRAHRSESFDDLAFTLNSLGLVRMAQGDTAEARELLEEAEAIAATNQHRIHGPVLASLADLHCMAGDLEKGQLLAQQSLQVTEAEYGLDDWRSKRAMVVNHYCNAMTGKNINREDMQSAAAALVQRWGEANFFSQRSHEQLREAGVSP
jgi:tetratricopeptide (TPR) repeat protein